MEVLIMGSPFGLLDYTTITVVLQGFRSLPFYRYNEGEISWLQTTIDSGALYYGAEYTYVSH